MLSYSENIWPNVQRNWPNVRAFDEFRSHLVTVVRIDQMRSSFGQTRSAIGQMRAHLVNCERIWPNARAQFAKHCAFGQMPHVFVRCAAHLAKCADWSNAPYIDIPITKRLALFALWSANRRTVISRDVKLVFFIFDIRFVIID